MRLPPSPFRKKTVKAVCDTHAWVCFVRVFDHPFFAATNEQGVFALLLASVFLLTIVVMFTE